MWVDGEPENQGNTQQVCRPNVLCISQMLLYICDRICKKGSYTRNYKYLEIPI